MLVSFWFSDKMLFTIDMHI